jgi:hypothetical protein
VNPFTRYLLNQTGRPEAQVFVQAWDAVEALIIRVYRARSATPGDEPEWRELRLRLRREYPRWRPRLTPFWQGASPGGTRMSRDPFEWLLKHGRAGDFVDNWTAMQTLPAARQALNTWLQASPESRAPSPRD